MAHIRQTRPDFGLESQANDYETIEVVPSSLENGLPNEMIHSGAETSMICPEGEYR